MVINVKEAIRYNSSRTDKCGVLKKKLYRK